MSVRLTLLVFALALTACEGPEGPIGPAGVQGDQGPQGAQGPQGVRGPAGDPSTAATELIDVNMSDLEYEAGGWGSSYMVIDSRITPETFIGVYFKAFFTNTGDEYYTPCDSRILIDGKSIGLQVLSGALRIFDPYQEMEETGILAIEVLSGG